VLLHKLSKFKTEKSVFISLGTKQKILLARANVVSQLIILSSPVSVTDSSDVPLEFLASFSYLKNTSKNTYTLQSIM
jgi:ABC-type molybdenum transport system ATPase subunit/photorepair protein PhrA